MYDNTVPSLLDQNLSFKNTNPNSPSWVSSSIGPDPTPSENAVPIHSIINGAQKPEVHLPVLSTAFFVYLRFISVLIASAYYFCSYEGRLLRRLATESHFEPSGGSAGDTTGSSTVFPAVELHSKIQAVRSSADPSGNGSWIRKNTTSSSSVIVQQRKRAEKSISCQVPILSA